MLIICPSCAAEYEVPVSRLKPGKMVRCARCGGEWLPPLEIDPEDPAAPTEDTAEPPHDHEDMETEDVAAMSGVTAMDRLAASTRSRQRRPGLIGAWIATFVVLSGGVAASVVWRDAVIRVWPASGRILAARQLPAAEPPPVAGPPIAGPPVASPERTLRPLAQTSDVAKTTQEQTQKPDARPGSAKNPQIGQSAGKKAE